MEAALRWHVLHGGVLSQQVIRLNLVDVGIVEDRVEGVPEPRYVLRLRLYEYVEVLCRPRQPVEVQGHAAEDRITDPFGFQGLQHLPHSVEIHLDPS